jgi:hypothetical protein
VLMPKRQDRPRTTVPIGMSGYGFIETGCVGVGRCNEERHTQPENIISYSPQPFHLDPTDSGLEPILSSDERLSMFKILFPEVAKACRDKQGQVVFGNQIQ